MDSRIVVYDICSIHYVVFLLKPVFRFATLTNKWDHWSNAIYAVCQFLQGRGQMLGLVGFNVTGSARASVT